MDMFAVGGEEFPAFRRFWVQRPEKGDPEFIVYALLDGPSEAGAYRFAIRPGPTTRVGVKLALFARRELTNIGIGTLNSMFLFGKNGHPLFSDFRPEVHDSDGLLMHTGYGEWIWHPLENGKATRFNSFLDDNPVGFGLMQRERNFASYQDPQAKYETRPNAWIQPRGRWGRGVVDLTQLLTANEYGDNVVASWHPAEALKPGVPLELEYEMPASRHSIPRCSLERRHIIGGFGLVKNFP
jgi:glucans biosynthesis protein